MNEDDNTLDAAGLPSTEEAAFMQVYYDVPDEVLKARILAAPGMGGALLVDLSKFMESHKSD